MAHLIDKDALVAEIKMLKRKNNSKDARYVEAKNVAYDSILSFIDIHGVKEVNEVPATVPFIDFLQEEPVPLTKENSTPFSGGERADSSKQGKITMARWCLRLDRSLSDDNRWNTGCTDEWGTYHSCEGCPHNKYMGDGKPISL